MCKFEKYGNCDEETKDQEYCIFHKPNKNEEEKEFYEKFLEKFKPKKEKIWDEFEEEEKERLVFEEGNYMGKIDCSGYVFPPFLDLEYAVFKKNVDFTGATFEGSVFFVHATFKRHASFSGATFKGLADFSFATFERGAGFYKATFKGPAGFGSATFKGCTEFNGATFEEDAEFEDAMFKESFEEEYSYARFRGATFEGIADFGGMEEGFECIFYCDELNFSNAEFRKGVNIDIPSECFKVPEAEAEACRVQKISYERGGRKDDADRMFVRERRALRKAKVEKAKTNVRKAEVESKRRIAFSSPRKVKMVKAKLEAWFVLIKAISNYLLAKASSSLEFLLADLTCKYGTNWQRPVILWMFVVFALSPLLYLATDLASGSANAKLDYLYSYLNYLYFSVSNVTPFGYGDLHLTGLKRIVAAAEAIFGTFMWAMFLAVFARKHMR